MIEKIILDYLSQNLDVPVHMEVPEEPPESFIVIEKTGSGRENRINQATVAVLSYAPTMYRAASLNDQVKAVLDDLIDLPEIGASQLNSDYNFTDTSEKRYRYQAVYDITYY